MTTQKRTIISCFGNCCVVYCVALRRSGFGMMEATMMMWKRPKARMMLRLKHLCGCLVQLPMTTSLQREASHRMTKSLTVARETCLTSLIPKMMAMQRIGADKTPGRVVDRVTETLINGLNLRAKLPSRTITKPIPHALAAHGTGRLVHPPWTAAKTDSRLCRPSPSLTSRIGIRTSRKL